MNVGWGKEEGVARLSRWVGLVLRGWGGKSRFVLGPIDGVWGDGLVSFGITGGSFEIRLGRCRLKGINAGSGWNNCTLCWTFVYGTEFEQVKIVPKKTMSCETKTLLWRSYTCPFYPWGYPKNMHLVGGESNLSWFWSWLWTQHKQPNVHKCW